MSEKKNKFNHNGITGEINTNPEVNLNKENDTENEKKDLTIEKLQVQSKKRVRSLITDLNNFNKPSKIEMIPVNEKENSIAKKLNLTKQIRYLLEKLLKKFQIDTPRDNLLYVLTSKLPYFFKTNKINFISDGPFTCKVTSEEQYLIEEELKDMEIEFVGFNKLMKSPDFLFILKKLQILYSKKNDPDINGGEAIVDAAIREDEEEKIKQKGLILAIKNDLEGFYDLYFRYTPKVNLENWINNLLEKLSPNNYFHENLAIIRTEIIHIDNGALMMQIDKGKEDILYNVDRKKVFEVLDSHALSIIERYNLHNKHYRFIKSLNNLKRDMKNTNLALVFGEKTSLKTEIEKILLNFEKSNKLKNEIISLADKTTENLLSHETIRNSNWLRVSNLSKLQDILIQPIKTEEDFLKQQSAFARIKIIHAALLLLGAYSEKRSKEATDAFVMKLNYFPDIFSLNTNVTTKTEDLDYIHDYDMVVEVNSQKTPLKLYIGEPKTIESCVRKMLSKESKIGSIDDVIFDGSRATISTPEEIWKDPALLEESIGTILGYFTPFLGTDILKFRTRYVPFIGAKKNPNSTGNSRRVSVTFLNKYQSLDSNEKNEWSQSRFELQIVPESEYKLPKVEKGHKNYGAYLKVLDERISYEKNRINSLRLILGFNTGYEDYFTSCMNEVVFEIDKNKSQFNNKMKNIVYMLAHADQKDYDYSISLSQLLKKSLKESENNDMLLFTLKMLKCKLENVQFYNETLNTSEEIKKNKEENIEELLVEALKVLNQIIDTSTSLQGSITPEEVDNLNNEEMIDEINSLMIDTHVKDTSNLPYLDLPSQGENATVKELRKGINQKMAKNTEEQLDQAIEVTSSTAVMNNTMISDDSIYISKEDVTKSLISKNERKNVITLDTEVVSNTQQQGMPTLNTKRDHSVVTNTSNQRQNAITLDTENISSKRNETPTLETENVNTQRQRTNTIETYSLSKIEDQKRDDLENFLGTDPFSSNKKE